MHLLPQHKHIRVDGLLKICGHPPLVNSMYICGRPNTSKRKRSDINGSMYVVVSQEQETLSRIYTTMGHTHYYSHYYGIIIMTMMMIWRRKVKFVRNFLSIFHLGHSGRVDGVARRVLYEIRSRGRHMLARFSLCSCVCVFAARMQE